VGDLGASFHTSACLLLPECLLPFPSPTAGGKYNDKA
jgi:hypothetical protein